MKVYSKIEHFPNNLVFEQTDNLFLIAWFSALKKKNIKQGKLNFISINTRHALDEKKVFVLSF